jgi:hypothetical protein
MMNQELFKWCVEQTDQMLPMTQRIVEADVLYKHLNPPAQVGLSFEHAIPRDIFRDEWGSLD